MRLERIKIDYLLCDDKLERCKPISELETWPRIDIENSCEIDYSVLISIVLVSIRFWIFMTLILRHFRGMTYSWRYLEFLSLKNGVFILTGRSYSLNYFAGGLLYSWLRLTRDFDDFEDKFMLNVKWFTVNIK